MNQKILIYDCEIIRCLPSAKKKTDSKLIYCQGWNDFHNMGISVIAFQILENINDHQSPIQSFANFNHLIPYKFTEFVKLSKECYWIIGFNSKEFDDKLLKVNGIKIKTNYDLLAEIRRSAYGSPDWEKQPKHWNYTLDLIAKANSMAKTGSGDLAPQLWQQGQYQKVIDYCMNDVRLTTQLLRLGLLGKLIDPNTGQFLTLRPLSD